MIIGKLVAKGGKPYQDKHTGEDITPVKGEVYFPKGTDLSEISRWNGKDVAISDPNVTQTGSWAEVHNKLDVLASVLMALSAVVEKKSEKEKTEEH